MNDLKRSNYTVSSEDDLFRYLEDFLSKVDQETISETSANSVLVFYLSFVCMYIDPPPSDSKDLFSIMLSSDPEQILYRASQILVNSNLFATLALKSFLISKLLSMLNLNIKLDNINLKLFLGYVFVSLISPKRNVEDLAQGTSFNINKISLTEDANGNNTSDLNESIFDILKSYTSFKIFYKILYFNNFIDWYSKRKNEIVSKYLEIAKQNDDEADIYEDVTQHEKNIQELEEPFKPSTDNISMNKEIESDFIKDEQYFLETCLVKEKAILFPETSNDINKALDLLTDEELNSSEVDSILRKFIDCDSEFKSIVYRMKKLKLSKIYTKLLSNYIKLNPVSFNEIILVNNDFIVNFLFKDLSIFEKDELADELNSSEYSSNSSSQLNDGVLNDELVKGLRQLDEYKNQLKKKNRLELHSFAELKFELIIALNEQYMVASYTQQVLKSQFNPLVLKSLIYYKNLKLVQIKNEINSILDSKLDVNKALEEEFQRKYLEEEQLLEELKMEQTRKNLTSPLPLEVDTNDLYEKVMAGYKEYFDELTEFEEKFVQLKEIFENDLFLKTERCDEFYNEFLTILVKHNKKNELDDAELKLDSLNKFLELSENECLMILKPKVQNLILNCLIGSNVSQGESLQDTMDIYEKFVAFLIYSFNRQSNFCNRILVLKILFLILKEMKHSNKPEPSVKLQRRRSIFASKDLTKKRDFGFYVNDLKVLVDIFIRELYNLSSEFQITVINNYLRVFYLLLEVTSLNYFKNDPMLLYGDLKSFNFDSKGYKRKEILDLLLYLSDIDINKAVKKYHETGELPPEISGVFDNSSEQRHDGESTKKLAKKCLSVAWLGLQNYIQEKRSELFMRSRSKTNASTPTTSEDSFPLLTRSSTGNSLSSSGSSSNNFSSTERLTLSKKLSNLRVSVNSSAASNSAVANHGNSSPNNISNADNNSNTVNNSAKKWGTANGTNTLALPANGVMSDRVYSKSSTNVDAMKPKTKKPPPPPPPPEAKAGMIRRVSNGSHKKLPPPPVPPSRKLRSSRSAVDLSKP